MIIDTNKLCTLILKTRVDKGLKQSYMARKLGISQKAYSYLESGRCKMDLVRFLKISEILEMNPMTIISKIVNDDHCWSGCREMESYDSEVLKLNKRVIYLESHNELLKDTIKKLIDQDKDL